MDAVSVTAARGFTAAGNASGIKNGAPDVAVVVSKRPAITSAVFTQNQAAAAPVVLSRTALEASSSMRAIVLNSGCANAATGQQGMANGRAMVHAVAAAIGCTPQEVLVCSTGTIGPQLPMDLVLPGIGDAVRSLESTPAAATRAATAIMTTDSHPKEFTSHGDGWTVGGMSKGAGMIRPNMATMLALITTDAVVEAELLDDALRSAVDGSFNSLNIDGCESTNDTVIAMASGVSGVTPEPEEFAGALEEVCRDLARQMAADAEGASRVVDISITGASNNDQARSIGRTITDSALVRSSFYGGDVNWGRILGAMGTSKYTIDAEAITISFEDTTVFVGGMQASYNENALTKAIHNGDFRVGVDLGDGDGSAHIVTTDLTPEYVIFNGGRS